MRQKVSRHLATRLAGLNMTEMIQTITQSKDPRTLRILAKSIYRELRDNGLREQDVMSLAGELLELVTDDVKNGSEARE
jgi:hypothetical protein